MMNNSNSVSIKWRHLIVLSNLRPSGIWIKLKPGAVEPFLLNNCIEGAPVPYVHVFRQGFETLTRCPKNGLSLAQAKELI